VGETIRQSDLRNDNAHIMRRVAEGESFTVTVHGRAVADIVPHRPDRALRHRLLSAQVFDELIAVDGPGPDVAAWIRDTADADRVFGDDAPADPWERQGRGDLR
jgi:prevent-host-death family protein